MILYPHHTHALITGMTGSGKTSLARKMLAVTPRAVVLDPQGDYLPDGVAFDSFRHGATFLVRNMEPAGKRFHIVYHPPSGAAAESAFRAWMRFAYQCQEEFPGAPPLAVFMEEASIYSDAGRVPPELDWLVRAGRKRGVCVCSVVQTDVDIGKAIRRNTGLHILCRQHAPSRDLRRMMPEVDKARSLETIQGPKGRAVEGKHYLVNPPGTDPVARWKQAVTAKPTGGAEWQSRKKDTPTPSSESGPRKGAANEPTDASSISTSTVS